MRQGFWFNRNKESNGMWATRVFCEKNAQPWIWHTWKSSFNIRFNIIWLIFVSKLPSKIQSYNSHFTGGHEKALTALPMSEEQMENCRLTLLQKTAKSTCILKNTYILDKVMNARNKVCQNLYVGKEVLIVIFYSPLHQKGLITGVSWQQKKTQTTTPNKVL